MARHQCGATRKENIVAQIKIAVAECEICTLRFPSQDSYKKHKISHTDRFKCETCQAGFSTNGDLIVHQKNPENCKRTATIRENAIKRSHLLLKPVQEKEEERIKTESENVQDVDLEQTTTDNNHSALAGVHKEDSEFDDFEMLNCDNCEKYFVSQESLDSHMSQCIAEYL